MPTKIIPLYFLKSFRHYLSKLAFYWLSHTKQKSPDLFNLGIFALYIVT